MLILSSFLATLPSILRSRAALELENLALRHQIGVLQRSAASRPKLVRWDRLLWIGLSRLWRDWRSALAIVRPETSYLGIVLASASSGPGRCAAANPDDPSFRMRSDI